MNRKSWTMIAVVTMAVLVAVPMMAHPRQAPGQGQGRGMGRGMGMGPAGPGGRGGGPMAVLRGVELTDAQREQIRGIMEAERANAQAQKVGDLERQLQLALLADAPDTAKIDGLKSAILAGTGEQLAHRIAVESKIVQVLTSEQRAQARENVGKMGPLQGRGR